MDEGIFGNFSEIVVPNDNLWFTFMTVISLTAGTAFIMWLGERITENGIGNGISLIIFAGIVARMPSCALSQLWALMANKAFNRALLPVLVGLMVVVIAGVVFMERGHAANSGSVRQAHGGSPHVRRAGDLFPDEGECVGRHSPHLRGRGAVVPGDLGHVAPVPQWVPVRRYRTDGCSTASMCC